MFRENGIEIVVSDLWGKKLCVNTTNLKQKFKSLKQLKTKNHKSVHNLWRLIRAKLVLFVNFLDHIFKTVFPKKNFSLYSKL